MTLRVFLPAISGLIFFSASSIADTSPQIESSCHSDYAANSFEAADYDLADFIDEYFSDVKIPFLPKKSDTQKLGLIFEKTGVYTAGHAYQRAGGKRDYPVHTGIWKIVDLGNSVTQIHLLIQNPGKLTHMQAFNTWNDLMGDAFSDYDDQAYLMTMQPEEIRYQYNGKYFTISIYIYGLKDDATMLPNSVADIVFTDYTKWVNDNRRCIAR